MQHVDSLIITNKGVMIADKDITDKNAQCRDGRFGSNVGQIGPKSDKSGSFSDQISVHLARGAKCTEI